MCSELCKDFYVVYQLELVTGEVESSCQLVVTFFFGLTLPNYRNKSGLAQPPLISTTSSAAAYTNWRLDWLWILASSKQQRNKMQVEVSVVFYNGWANFLKK